MIREQQPLSNSGLSRKEFLAAFIGGIIGGIASRYADKLGILDFIPSLPSVLRDFQMDPERDLVAYLKGKKVRIVRNYGEYITDDSEGESKPDLKRFLEERAQLTVVNIDQDKDYPFLVKFDRDQDNNLYQTRYERVSGRDTDEYLDIFDRKFLRDFAKRDRRLTARRLNSRGFMVGLEKNIVDGLPNSEYGIIVWSLIFIPRYDFPLDSLLAIGSSYDLRTQPQLGGYYNYTNENFASYRIKLGASRSPLNSTRARGEYTLLLNQQEVFPPTLKSPIFKDSDPQFFETVHNDFDDPLRLVLLSPKTGEVFYNNVNLGKLRIPFYQN